MLKNFTILFSWFIGLILSCNITGYSAGLNNGTHDRPDKDASPEISLEVGEEDKIKIGLLLPKPPEKDQTALSSYQGARLAISEANEEGGYGGTPFKLVVRTTEGLWGAGSKEAVKLVYEDEVTAIITALDGRNAHLAEQVAAKAQIVQIAARASDETLSQAYVPWFFRVVPDDRQQARALIREIKNKKESDNLTILYRDDYDYKMAAETFNKLAINEDLSIKGMYSFSGAGSPDEPLVESGNESGGYGDAVVIFSDYIAARSLMEKIEAFNSGIQVYGNLYMTMDGSISSDWIPSIEEAICVSSRFCFSTPGQPFKKAFYSNYNHMPNPAASYSYDAVNLVIEAIRKAGVDKQDIRDTLSKINYTEGVTGPVSFDEHGNRVSSVFLIKIIKGHPVILP